MPVILKEANATIIRYSDDSILLFDNKTNELVETVFVAPVGKIFAEKDGKARVVVEGYSTGLDVSTFEFDDWIKNYLVAISLAKNKDVIQEFKVLS